MTCFQILEELARSVELLIWDDAEGRLVLSRVGTKRAGSSLVEGQNIEIGTAHHAGNERYSLYSVVGQVAVFDNTKRPYVNIEAVAADEGVPRRRVLIIVMDAPGPDNRWAQQRANWEKARRFGRSNLVTITVTGWRDGAGNLWQPNTVVGVKAPNLKIDRDLVIAQATWMRSEAGTQTRLVWMPRRGS